MNLVTKLLIRQFNYMKSVLQNENIDRAATSCLLHRTFRLKRNQTLLHSSYTVVSKDSSNQPYYMS